MRLGYIIVYAPDVTAEIEFYEAAFGLSRRFIHESGQYAEMVTGTTALAFAAEELVSASGHSFRANRASDNQPAGAEVAFVSDDVQAAYDRALKAGAVSYDEPRQKP